MGAPTARITRPSARPALRSDTGHPRRAGHADGRHQRPGRKNRAEQAKTGER